MFFLSAFRAGGTYKNPKKKTNESGVIVMCNIKYYQEGEARSLSDEGL